MSMQETTLGTGKFITSRKGNQKLRSENREHNMIRFEKGEPKWVWYSQHSNGQNFAYSVVHKSGDRVCVAVV